MLFSLGGAQRKRKRKRKMQRWSFITERQISDIFQAGLKSFLLDLTVISRAYYFRRIKDQ